MIPNVPFEATFLRTALLAGVVREADACAWAEALLESATNQQGALAEVALAPLELTAMREALRPLASEALARDAGAALLAYMALDPATARLGVSDQLRVLSVLRREAVLSDAANTVSKEFEDRHMLASAAVAGEAGPVSAEVMAWLHTARPTVYFRFAFDHHDEQAAFLAALSRVIVRERRAGGAAPGESSRAWTVEGGGPGRGALVLDERLWIAAVEAFSPLPVGSRIPYAGLPAHAVEVLDEATASPMGVDEATAVLAV